MSGNNSSSKMVILRSADGEMFEIEEAVAMESQTIKHMIEDNCANSTIPLPNVTSKILVKIIEYCKYHAAHASKQNSEFDQKPFDVSESAASVVDELKKFDEEFVKVDQGTLFEIILAANYLNIQSLLDLTCQTVANMIKGKTGQQIRKMFNIKNDFTAAEEAEIMRENAWAFE